MIFHLRRTVRLEQVQWPQQLQIVWFAGQSQASQAVLLPRPGSREYREYLYSPP